MSKVNQYLATQAAEMENPLTFTSTAADTTEAAVVATVQGNIDLILTALSYEATDPTVHRLFLDEMSHVARVSMYKMLSDLKDSVEVFVIA